MDMYSAAHKKFAYFGGMLILRRTGDVEFCLSALRSALHLDREVILQMNTDKLRKRFPAGYSDAAAKERLDEASAWRASRD